MTALRQTMVFGLAGGALLALLAVAARGYADVWTAMVLTGLPFCN